MANIIGAILPDIDQASNRLWDLLPAGNLMGKMLKKLFWGHRSLSHSILGIGLTYYGLWWLIPKLINENFVDTKIVIISLMIGYGSHLVLDCLTEEGLPLFFPIRKKFGFPPFKFMRIKTDGWVERWVVFPVLIVMIVGLLGWKILIG